MHILVVLVMVAVIQAHDCPETCECGSFLREPLGANASYTKVTCTGVFNSTNKFPITTNSLIIRDILEEDIEDLLLDVLPNVVNLPYLFHITLTRCAIPDLSNVSFSGLEKLQSLEISNSQVTRLPSTPTNFNLTSLKALGLSNNEIQVIDSNPFGTLTSLTVLNLSENVIKVLTAKSFVGLTVLEYLDLSINKISRLDNEVFAPLHALQYLNLSNNQLEVLDEACLSSLLRLQQLDVSWNRLARMAPGSLQLPSLARLLLAGNPGLGDSRQPTLLVGPGKRLQTVDASRTGLKQVPAALTHSIRTLRLAGNSIGFVSCGDFDSYPLLQLLDFTSNNLENIEDDALGRLDLLSILYLSDNKLRFLPHSLPERLKILHLEHNKIEQISSGDLQGMPALEVLLLSDNKVKVVRDGAFSQLGSLATLDLSRNPIRTLPPAILSGPWQLQVLRLSELDVVSPARDMAFPLPTPEHLIVLDLSHSPGLAHQLIADNAALAAARELQELDLAGGNLEYIRSDLLHFLPQLRVLRLDDNPLNCTALQWLALWMRRQDQPKYRSVICANPPEYSGSLLIDLQDIEVLQEATTIQIKPVYLQNSVRLVNNNSKEIELNISSNRHVLNITTKEEKLNNSTRVLTQPPLELNSTQENHVLEELSNLTSPLHTEIITSNFQPVQLTTAMSPQNSLKENNSINKKLTSAILRDTQSNKNVNGETLRKSQAFTNKTQQELKNTAQPPNANEVGNFLNNKLHRANGRTEITQNLFIASEVNPFNIQNANTQNINKSGPTAPPTTKHVLYNSSILTTIAKPTDSTVSDELEQGNITIASGKMPLMTENNQKSNFMYSGVLLFVIGVLASVSTLVIAASVFKRRRKNLMEQDIEVSSLPSVTELW